MSPLEFYYVPTGILLCPYWNFIMSLLEFYYVPKLEKVRKIGDFFGVVIKTVIRKRNQEE